MFAGTVTMAGRLFPVGLGFVVRPGDFTSYVLPAIKNARTDISLACWFTNVWTWALVGEVISLVLERRRNDGRQLMLLTPDVSASPNPRLQRTRLRSPLSRKPLGDRAWKDRP